MEVEPNSESWATFTLTTSPLHFCGPALAELTPHSPVPVGSLCSKAAVMRLLCKPATLLHTARCCNTEPPVGIGLQPSGIPSVPWNLGKIGASRWCGAQSRRARCGLFWDGAAKLCSLHGTLIPPWGAQLEGPQ